MKARCKQYVKQAVADKRQALATKRLLALEQPREAGGGGSVVTLHKQTGHHAM